MPTPSPKKFASLPLEPVNVTVHGKKKKKKKKSFAKKKKKKRFSGVVKVKSLRWGHYPGPYRWALNTVTYIIIKGKQGI